MTKKYKFQDSILVDQPVCDALRYDANEILRRSRNPQLEVVIDTTHSGVITNLRMYPAMFVSKGYKSFISKDNGGTADFNKPILKHHDLASDPIGRVTGAKFTALKTGEQFEYDYLYPEDVGGRGSGVVTVTGIITDEDAIKKIIDGRFLSVSATHTSDRMLCSTCGADILGCNHVPGKHYDSDGEETDQDEGSLCYAITGNLTYHEVSFVNVPAQPPAKLVNFNWQDVKTDGANELLSTLVRGKKETVRSFVLRDSDGELSLLTGNNKTPSKKAMIAVSPVIADKLKQAVSSAAVKEPDEINDVHQETDTATKTTDAGTNLNQAIKNDTDSNTEEIPMDNKELETLQAESKRLADELTTAKTTIAELEQNIQVKDSEIQRLTTDATEMQAKLTRTLASNLASMRIRLKKPGTEGIDSKEKLDAYVEKLLTRSLESLQDSINDLTLEVNKEPEEPKKVVDNGPDAASLMKADKVEPATLAKGDKPKAGNDKVVASEKKATEALDHAFKFDK